MDNRLFAAIIALLLIIVAFVVYKARTQPAAAPAAELPATSAPTKVPNPAAYKPPPLPPPATVTAAQAAKLAAAAQKTEAISSATSAHSAIVKGLASEAAVPGETSVVAYTAAGAAKHILYYRELKNIKAAALAARQAITAEIQATFESPSSNFASDEISSTVTSALAGAATTLRRIKEEQLRAFVSPDRGAPDPLTPQVQALSGLLAAYGALMGTGKYAYGQDAVNVRVILSALIPANNNVMYGMAPVLSPPTAAAVAAATAALPANMLAGTRQIERQLRIALAATQHKAAAYAKLNAMLNPGQPSSPAAYSFILPEPQLNLL